MTTNDKFSSGIVILRNVKLYCSVSITLTAYYRLVYHYLNMEFFFEETNQFRICKRCLSWTNRVIRLIAGLKMTQNCKNAFRDAHLNIFISLKCSSILNLSVIAFRLWIYIIIAPDKLVTLMPDRTGYMYIVNLFHMSV